MAGANNWHVRRLPVRFVSRIAAHSSSGISRAGVRLIEPAQLIRMSTRPNAARTASRAWVTDLRSVTSIGVFRERRPRRSISHTVSSTASRRREHGTTSAPASARPIASALPMPDVPPVMTATFPSRLRGANTGPCLPSGFEADTAFLRRWARRANRRPRARATLSHPRKRGSYNPD